MTSSPPSARPTALAVAAGLVGLEAAAALVTGIVYLVLAFTAHPSDRGIAALLAVTVTLYGVGVAVVARGVWRARRWSRTPAYLTQFFAIVVAVGQLHVLPVPMGGLLAVAVAAVVTLSLPASREAFEPA